MKKFFISLILFVCFISLLIISVSLYFMKKYQLNADNITPINFSRSISFNEKMQFLHDNNTKPSVISLGSSTSLNNIDSRQVEKYYNTNTLNTASWGMNIGEDFKMLKLFSSIYPLKTVVMCSNYGDFVNNEKSINLKLLPNYLTHNDNPFLTFLETFNLKYFLDNYKLIKSYRTEKGYGYLHFDKYGGINIDSSNFIIKKFRWKASYLNQPSSIEQYGFLDSISNFCKTKNIELVFFEPPYRNGLFTTLSKEDSLTLQTHIKKVNLILKKYNFSYINSLDTSWSDKLFVDGIHLNASGAEDYTKYCFDKLSQINKSH